jgi:TPP-dependent 2-oxoacid decarboxylase
MKNKDIKELACVVNLTSTEEIEIVGGTMRDFWGDIGYVIGAIIGAGVTMGEGARGNSHF